MLIKETGNGWSEKVNFIDENDVFVGFDTAQDCCEDAGYFVSKDANEPYQYDKDRSGETPSLDGYNFDTTFFQHVSSKHLDDGDQVCFKMVKQGNEDLYLHLYNSHNGYYGHGFEAKISGEVWQSGCL